MLPRIDLPELILEGHARTGCLDAYTHISEATARMDDLALSVAACLVAGACNLGYTPAVNRGHLALTPARLSYAEQNYVRAETHRAADALEALLWILRPQQPCTVPAQKEVGALDRGVARHTLSDRDRRRARAKRPRVGDGPLST